MFAVVLHPYQPEPQIVTGPYPTLAALLKDVRRFICPIGAEICERVDGCWLVVDVLHA